MFNWRKRKVFLRCLQPWQGSGITISAFETHGPGLHTLTYIYRPIWQNKRKSTNTNSQPTSYLPAELPPSDRAITLASTNDTVSVSPFLKITVYAMSSTNKTSRSCALLALPGELRNLIYAFAVVEDRPIIAYFVEKPVWCTDSDLTAYPDYHRLETKTTSYPHLPAIALACHQTYKEVAPVFYGQNTFISTIKSQVAANVFLRSGIHS